MSRSPELYQWRTEIAQHFPHLSQPMVMGLALWSLGMILVRSCSLTAIADWWSCQLGQPFQTVRERLRDTYREAEAKAGPHRAELDLSPCWAPWLAWVLEGWSGTTLALAPYKCRFFHVSSSSTGNDKLSWEMGTAGQGSGQPWPRGNG